MTEGELARAAAGGDANAAREIVRTYDGMVRALVYRTAKRDRHLIDDLVQDVWLIVFRKLDSYDPAIAKLSTWIGVIARRAAVSRGVRERLDKDRATIPLELVRGDSSGDPFQTLLELQPSRELGALEQIERIEEHAMVVSAREYLTPRQRQVVDLYLEGVDAAAARCRMQCTKENVNDLLHKAGRRIRFVLPYLRRSGMDGAYSAHDMLPN